MKSSNELWGELEDARRGVDRLAFAERLIDLQIAVINAKQPIPSVSEADAAYCYLRNLFLSCAPQCTPLPDLIGVCTQIDNVIAGYRIKLSELPDPSK